MCTETVLAVGAIGLCRHNTFMRLISQHIPVVMTLHMVLTFIHITCVSKLNTDVMITNHSLMYQKYCPDVSSCITTCISSAITQRDGWRHMTPWELVGSRDISYKGASNLLSLNNHTSPKPLIKTVEITRLIGSGDISYKGASNLLSLNNHTQHPYHL